VLALFSAVAISGGLVVAMAPAASADVIEIPGGTGMKTATIECNNAFGVSTLAGVRLGTGASGYYYYDGSQWNTSSASDYPHSGAGISVHIETDNKTFTYYADPNVTYVILKSAKSWQRIIDPLEGTVYSSQVRNKNGNAQNISHLTFCYGEQPPESNQAQVTLSKVWAEGAKAGDTVSLTITGEGVAAGATGGESTAPGSETDTLAIASVTPGTTIVLAEAFGTKMGEYTPSLECKTNTGSYLTVSLDGGLSGSFDVPPYATSVDCRFTNTVISGESGEGDSPAIVTLSKNWIKGFTGDAVNLTIAGANEDDADAVSDYDPGYSGVQASDKDAQATALVTPGAEITLGEAFEDGPNGTYETTLECAVDGGEYSTVTPLDGLTGKFKVPTGAESVNCHFTNTGRPEKPSTTQVTLSKVWEGGVAGDQVELRIAGEGVADGSATDGESTTPESEGDKSAKATVTQGTKITLSESYRSGAKGQYQAALNCMVDGEDSQVVGLNGGLSGTFEVPEGAQAVACTFTNTHKTSGGGDTPPGGNPGDTSTDTTPEVQGVSRVEPEAVKPPIEVEGVSQELPPAPVIKVKPAAQVAPAPSANAHTGQGQSPWAYLLFGAGALLLLGAWRVRRNGNA
jgi:MYXO-CTERM domain-containing protein